MHFQGYVVDVLKKEIIHIDSLRAANGKNPISEIIAKVLFEQKEVRLKSYFTTKVQFDSNSCGVWLIAAMGAYVYSLPKPSVRNDAFDIALSLLERKKEFRDENVEFEVPSSENWKSEGHIKIYTSATFLIDVSKNNPANSPFYTEVLSKGIRPNYRTLNDVLAKTKKLLKTGIQTEAVYDKISNESVGVYASSSQGQEGRDTRQVYRQEEKNP